VVVGEGDAVEPVLSCRWAWATRSWASLTSVWYRPRSPARSAASASVNFCAAWARRLSTVPGVPGVPGVDGVDGVDGVRRVGGLDLVERLARRGGEHDHRKGCTSKNLQGLPQ